jgi:outer membrane protein
MNRSIFIAALAWLCAFSPNVAQAQKIGHMNFQNIIQAMPEYTKASNEYELYKQSLEDELKAIEAEAMAVNKKYELESKKPQPSQTRLKLYAQNIETMQLMYQEKQQSIQDSLSAKMTELVAPIKKKVEEAVAEVAKAQGYSHIIDNSYGMLIYAAEENNVEAAVKTKLGIKDKPAANPGAGKPVGMPGAR